MLMGSMELLLEGSEDFNYGQVTMEGAEGCEFIEEALLPLEEEWCKLDSAIAKANLDLYQEAATGAFLNRIGEGNLSEAIENLEALSEATFNDSVKKVKDFFVRFYNRIKAFIGKFISFLDRYTMKDKNFVKKYEKLLMGKDDSKFEFTAYPLKKFKDSGDIISGNVPDANHGKVMKSVITHIKIGSSTTMDQIDSIRKNKESLFKKVRAEELGVSGEVESGDESKALNKSKWGSEDGPEKKDFKGFGGDFITKNDCLKVIGHADKTISALKKLDKDTTKALNDVIKVINDRSQEVFKAEDANTKSDAYRQAEAKYTITTAGIRVASSAFSRNVGFTISAVRLFKSESRRVLTQFARHNPNKLNEGTETLDESTSAGELDNILAKYM